MPKNSRFVLQLGAIVLSMAVLVSSNESLGASLRDLVNIDDQQVASFLSQQEKVSQYERSLENGVRQFGDRCGNRYGCVEGFECSEVNYGKRCLPNSCLQANSNEIADIFDVDNLFRNSGVSKDDIFAKLATVKDERAFLETPEFQAFQQAFHKNLGPLQAAIELQRTCIDSRQNGTDTFQTGTVSYIGLHIEVSEGWGCHVVSFPSSDSFFVRPVLLLMLLFNI